MPTFGAWEAHRARARVRRGRLHLPARLLRGARRRPASLPRLARSTWTTSSHDVVATADHVRRQAAQRASGSTCRSTSGTSGTMSAFARHTRPLELAAGPAPPRGRLHRRGRRRRGEPAHRPAAARRPGQDRLPGPARQRHRPDPHRAGRPAWRQTIFHPFAQTARLARGTSLRVEPSGASHETALHGLVDTVDASATWDEDDRRRRGVPRQPAPHRARARHRRRPGLRGPAGHRVPPPRGRRPATHQHRSAPQPCSLRPDPDVHVDGGRLELRLTPGVWTAVALTPNPDGRSHPRPPYPHPRAHRAPTPEGAHRSCPTPHPRGTSPAASSSGRSAPSAPLRPRRLLRLEHASRRGPRLQRAFGPGRHHTGPKVALAFWNGFTGGDGPFMKGMVEEFNKANPNVTVSMNTLQWADYYAKVPNAVSSGAGPDVGIMHIDQLATNAARRVIVPARRGRLRPRAHRVRLRPRRLERGHLPGQALRHPPRHPPARALRQHRQLSKAGIDALPTDRAGFEAAIKALQDKGGARTRSGSRPPGPPT